ncbi:MAG: chromosomal replication initiator protein DnaA [Acidobacteriota bacterium]|nr:chromosomal replication initiator protein DnaA [Acidobacteriota bacterium]
MTGSSIWDQVLSRIETKVNRHIFYTWFKPTAFVADDGGTLRIRVPNGLFRDWLTKHYAAVLDEALGEIDRAGTAVTFETESGPATGAASVARASPERSGSDIPVAVSAPSASTRTDGPGVQGSEEPEPDTETVAPGTLAPRYSFDTFIVGSSNQFAHAACRAVAEAPSRSYNPLFIYGGVGLGKTHLMHAIGHYVLNRLKTLKLTYISSERFMNEMINGVRYDRVLDFRERYRSVDVLLVDDIQFLAGKEGTQTEFFHTFNALYDSQKQIVISSDRPPHEIPQLEERLRSRFEWGLIADIQPPDLETKVAILKRKAESEGVPLPDDVALYIAGKIKSNIRELEGSLIRLVAYASLTGREISLPLAQDVLRNVLQHDERAVTIEGIQKYVSDYYQLKHGELKSRNNSKSIAMPRQIAMYLCKSLTNASLPEIGRSFGGKHHSTVIHSIRKIEGLRQNDGNFNTLINTFLESFR